MSISPSAPAPPSWRLRPAQRVLHRQWDDEFVVYNDASGASHLLDGGGFAILELLRERPAGLSAAAIAAELAPQCDDPAQFDASAVVLMLGNLVACELVEACP